MNSDHVHLCRASWFNPGDLTSMGHSNLKSSASPGEFESWLNAVERKTGQYAKRTIYVRHWLNGRTPEEAIELVTAELAADEMAQRLSHLI